nr:pyruvate dehydrogenase (acetyl-transferring), homodimeric type [candidate division Zixibacteria bacterium]
MTEKEKFNYNNSLEEENLEWLESLDDVFETGGLQRLGDLLELLRKRAAELGLPRPTPGRTTDYINTIPPQEQPPYPGSREIERRIKSIIRWNAMAMVVRANRHEHGIGGHISTYASAATLYEVGFNHFFRGRGEKHPGDLVYFQGHASPGIYARAFLEGRLNEGDLENFRRELDPNGGLSSYPHPWLMPNFWQFPTVSMGLGPIMAIYQARFNRYLEQRGLIQPSDQKIWAFLGDGETDEPETLGAITLASREKLDNLIFVINCNLQRLDGPVRGNGKIIQELEAAFHGAGWNVIKVVWGSQWDPLLEKDTEGRLVRRMNETPDGQFQKYTVSTGDYIRRDFFGRDPKLLEMVKNYSDEQLEKLNRGGHDPAKVYAAYKAAFEHRSSPTVILAKTVKGYGLGEAGEGRNVTHQQKKLNEEELREFRSRFGIPISDREIAEAPFYRPPDDSHETRYLLDRRKELGGYLPRRVVNVEPITTPDDQLFGEYYEGTEDREVSTTMVFVHMLSKLMHDPKIGKNIIPIVPDEMRTFGMEALFRKFGIYSSVGQLYEPVDKEALMYYREAKDGAILEEGITEAGSMSSFIAAGTSYASHGLNLIPFFVYYSMFGFQRIGDLIWAAADMQTKGFLVGGTSGRTTLSGEGLQHQDGNSHLLAYPVPNLKAYDPAFAYELAVIIRDGIRRMFENGENIFYYLTVANEFYTMPPRPDHVEDEAILKGLYRYHRSDNKTSKARAHLLGSGAILNEAVRAGEILEEKFGLAADIWSVTGYKELYLDALHAERYNMLHPAEDRKKPYLTSILEKEKGVFIAASDYVRALPASIAKWVPGPFLPLGTDGFGRSDGRKQLRDFFEVDARYIALAALSSLWREKAIERKLVEMAIKELDINPDKLNPLIS